MPITRKRFLTAAAIACSTCAAAIPSGAQADPGTGQGLVPFPTLTCTNLATGAMYIMNFLVPGAQNAANRGTGAANAPYPGFLVSYTPIGTAPPVPTGTWQLLPGGIPGRVIGNKTGLQGDAFDCGAPTGNGV
jgi:hypothetical protein